MPKELKKTRGADRRRMWTACEMRDIVDDAEETTAETASKSNSVPVGNVYRWTARLSDFLVLILKFTIARYFGKFFIMT